MNEGGICAFGVKGIRYLGGRIHETWILIDVRRMPPGQLCWEVGQRTARRAVGHQRRDTYQKSLLREGLGEAKGDKGWCVSESDIPVLCT